MSKHPTEYAKKSAALLRAFHRKLAKNGIDSHLHRIADNSEENRIHIEAVRIKANFTVTITEEYQIEISLTDRRRFVVSDDAAIDLIFSLVRKGIE